MKQNLILNADSYKASHYNMYPENTTGQYAYIEARKKYETIIPFGLQMAIKKYLLTPITLDDIEEAEQIITQHGLPFNRDGWLKIVNEYNGLLPITIKGVLEGTPTESSTPIVTIECEDDDLFWLPSYIETWLQRAIWYPSTIASNGYKNYKILKESYNRTSDNKNNVVFSLNDFASRGVTSEESSEIGGLAHLLFFRGTDNLAALRAAKEYYHIPMAGFSIPATEHSVQCAYGKDNQLGYLHKVIDGRKAGDMVSIVLDGYDIFRDTELLCSEFKTIIQQSGVKAVIRPDCYDEQTQILTPTGWVFFKDLQDDDLVAQVLDDNTYEFVKPLKYTNQHYVGKMYHFINDHGKVDLLVTPNHRMVTYNGKDIGKIVSAEDCKLHFKRGFKRSAAAQDTGKTLSDIERLKIAFQADGSFTTTGNKIRFSFSKQRKIDRMYALLDKIGCEYVTYDFADGRCEINIHLDAKLFLKDFSWVKIDNLSKSWCIDFIEELSYWDSTRRSDSRFKFDTTIKAVIDTVEIIALSAGYGCLLSHREDDRKSIFSDVYTAHIMKSNKIGGQAIKINTIDYDGKVYCVTVPSGKLFVKRNRCTLISGNSGNAFDIIPKLIDTIDNHFGHTVNSKGFKVLNNISLIQGDGIDMDMMQGLCSMIENLGYAAETLVYGSGGGLLQKVNRDTYSFAQKTSAMKINGEWIDTVKQPITSLDKSSKGGRFDDLNLTTYYHNGKLLVDDELDTIRSRLPI